MENFKFIDLFCGIGGFHQAMTDLGGKCVYACDIDAECRKTYKTNYGIMPDGDITKVDPKDIPVHDVLCGGFPCQAFSKAGKRLGFADSTKGTLFFDMWETIPKWKQNFIRKNSQLYKENKGFIDDWLKRAKKNPLFFGAKAKFEW